MRREGIITRKREAREERLTASFGRVEMERVARLPRE